MQQPPISEYDIAGPHLDLYNALYRQVILLFDELIQLFQINPNNLLDVDAPVASQFLRSSGIELSFLSQVGL
jgi:hypothetical protein